MWDFYSGKVVFITGASGFLGTALVHRIVTQAPVAHIFLLCRGGLQHLRQQWSDQLPLETVEAMCDVRIVTVIDGDILKDDMGVAAADLKLLEESVNIVIHAASSINLVHPLEKISEVVIGASERIANFALGVEALDRFVYVSTAYANSHLYKASKAADIVVDESVTDLGSQRGVLEEWQEVQARGSSIEFEAHDFPWPYGYAKHLTERLVEARFTDAGKADKLFILRPSIIGPAQEFPYPGFIRPKSTPIIMAMAAIAATPSLFGFMATRADDPETQITLDEVPIDVVVDRLLVHLAKRTASPVHAVSGKRARTKFMSIVREAMQLRRIPWRLRVLWTFLDWHSPLLHVIARTFVVAGTSYDFSDIKTEDLWESLGEKEQASLQLFNTNASGNYDASLQVENIQFMAARLARRSFWGRVLFWLFPMI